MKHQFVIMISALMMANIASAELIIQPSAIANNSPIATVTTPTIAIASGLVTTPTEASIERLMQVLHVNEMIDTTLAEQKKLAGIMQKIPTTSPNVGKGIFNPKKQQQLQEVLSKYGKVFGAQIDNPARRDQMVTAYKTAVKNNYNQADVNTLIEFYQTPMGQQLLQKQNQVTLDYVQNVMPATVGKSAENLEQVFPMIEQDIKKIFE